MTPQDRETIRLQLADLLSELRAVRRRYKARTIRLVQVVRALLSREAP
jgi:hypothetical protein